MCTMALNIMCGYHETPLKHYYHYRTVVSMYNEIIKRKNDGLINVRKHPFLDLEICNYTQRTQYERRWDEYTKACRGLILDGDHNIISRPLQKFFNLGEVEETQIVNLPDELQAFSEKLDGVFGILYSENDKVAIASRGSFDSE